MPQQPLRRTSRAGAVPQVLSLLLPLLFLTACINRDYDLSNGINTDITIGAGGITLPVGNTEPILLTELITESDLVTIEEGQYVLRKSGDIEAVTVTIDPVEFNIAVPEIDPVFADFRFEEELDRDLSSNASARLGLPTGPLFARIETTANLTLDEKVPSELRRLLSLSLRDGSRPKMTLRLTFPDDFPTRIGRLTFCNFALTLPSFITFADADVVNGTLILNESFSPGRGYERELTVSGFDFTRSEGEGGLHMVAVGDEMRLQLDTENAIRLSGSVKTDDDVLLTPDDLRNVPITPSLTLDPIAVGTVTGTVDPAIDVLTESIELALDEELDFLREDAVLNLHNPQLLLSLSNTMGVPVRMNLNLSARSADGATLPGTTLAPIPVTLRGAEKEGEPTYTRVLISKQGTERDGYQAIAVPELSNLLTTVPDLIAVEMSASADPDETHRVNLDPLSPKTITGSYDVVVPLRFEELDIRYTEIIRDLGNTLRDIADNQEELILLLRTTAANTVPVNLTLNVEGYDANEKRIAGIHSESALIEAGNGTDTAVDTPLTLRIRIEKGALPHLETLHLNIEGNAVAPGDGVPLRADQFVQLNRLTLTLLGGITITNK